MAATTLSGLDLLATAVMLVDEAWIVRYMNPAAENLFGLSSTAADGHALDVLFQGSDVLTQALDYASDNNCSYSEHGLTLSTNGHSPLHLSCTVTPVEVDADSAASFLIEFRHIEQQLKIAREERMLDQSQANRELIRNLAHEIKNPLGGIRGAAQLLDHELERPALHEYTQVIMKEADRLQSLMDRLLTPHRLPQPSQVNIHEVLERVRSVIHAEFPRIAVRRDYDTSLPTVEGDREQLIQAMLNITRNAAQAIAAQSQVRARRDPPEDARRASGHARAQALPPRHRSAHHRQRPRHSRRHPRPHFYPLVSGREGGSGLGLMLAQNFISQHHGTVTFESSPGQTYFSILLPLKDTDEA